MSHGSYELIYNISRTSIKFFTSSKSAVDILPGSSDDSESNMLIVKRYFDVTKTSTKVMAAKNAKKLAINPIM